MLFKELLGKEIIDRDGETVGVLEDIVISQNGKVTHIIALPTGIISALKPQMTIHFDDVDAIEDVVLLKKSRQELKE